MADFKLENPTTNEALLLHQIDETKADVANMKAQIGEVKNDYGKLSTKVNELSIDVRGLSREIIDSNARTDVYNKQAHDASNEMLGMLKEQLSYFTESETSRDEFSRVQRQQLWKAIVAGVGGGGVISLLITKLLGG